jgi:hypothetical protein
MNEGAENNNTFFSTIITVDRACFLSVREDKKLITACLFDSCRSGGSICF